MIRKCTLIYIIILTGLIACSHPVKQDRPAKQDCPPARQEPDEFFLAPAIYGSPIDSGSPDHSLFLINLREPDFRLLKTECYRFWIRPFMGTPALYRLDIDSNNRAVLTTKYYYHQQYHYSGNNYWCKDSVLRKSVHPIRQGQRDHFIQILQESFYKALREEYLDSGSSHSNLYVLEVKDYGGNYWRVSTTFDTESRLKEALRYLAGLSVLNKNGNPIEMHEALIDESFDGN